MHLVANDSRRAHRPSCSHSQCHHESTGASHSEFESVNLPLPLNRQEQTRQVPFVCVGSSCVCWRRVRTFRGEEEVRKDSALFVCHLTETTDDFDFWSWKRTVHEEVRVPLESCDDTRRSFVADAKFCVGGVFPPLRLGPHSGVPAFVSPLGWPCRAGGRTLVGQRGTRLVRRHVRAETHVVDAGLHEKTLTHLLKVASASLEHAPLWCGMAALMCCMCVRMFPCTAGSRVSPTRPNAVLLLQFVDVAGGLWTCCWCSRGFSSKMWTTTESEKFYRADNSTELNRSHAPPAQRRFFSQASYFSQAVPMCSFRGVARRRLKHASEDMIDNSGIGASIANFLILAFAAHIAENPTRAPRRGGAYEMSTSCCMWEPKGTAQSLWR